MKNLCDEYILAESVEEALGILTEAKGSARLLSGGSDLLLEIQQGKCPEVRTLIDVSGIDEMCRVELREKSLFIGASVTLRQLIDSSLVKSHAEALAEAAACMANPQVCNVATIGGNVAHALPAADGSIALLALDAQAEVANVEGKRTVPLQTLFKGPGVSTLAAECDLLVGFYLPVHGKGQASVFLRHTNPQGIPLATVNMAVWLERKAGRITHIRIAIGPAGPVPFRAQETEEVLIGQVPSQEVMDRARDELLKETQFRTSPHRASKEYRYHLASLLLQDALKRAWLRAGRTEP